MVERQRLQWPSWSRGRPSVSRWIDVVGDVWVRLSKRKGSARMTEWYSSVQSGGLGRWKWGMGLGLLTNPHVRAFNKRIEMVVLGSASRQLRSTLGTVSNWKGTTDARPISLLIRRLRQQLKHVSSRIRVLLNIKRNTVTLRTLPNPVVFHISKLL